MILINAQEYAQQIVDESWPSFVLEGIEQVSSFEVKLHCIKYIDDEETLHKTLTIKGTYADKINKKIKNKLTLEEINSLQNRIDWLKESIKR